MSDGDASAVALRAWIEGEAGGVVTAMVQVAGGGSREAWLVDTLDRRGTPRPLFARRDTGGGPVSGTDLTLAREARVCQEVARHGIPAATIVAVHPGGDLVLSERVAGPGGADFGTLIAAPNRDAIVADFVGHLSRLHSIDVASVDLPELERPVSGGDHARLEVARWRKLYEDKAPDGDPILETVFAWLDEHAPSQVERTVLAHGDCGPGNFMFDDERVTCIVDWEFAHFGDPMDDIAWLGFRHDASGERIFSDLPASLDAWSRATGLPIDRSRVSYYGLLVLARCATCAIRGLDNAAVTIDNSVWHRLQPRLALAMTRLLADLAAVALEPTATVEPRAMTSVDTILATLRRDLEHVVRPALVGENAAKRAAGDEVLLRYLAAAHPLEPVLDQLEVDDLNAELGTSHRHPSEGLADLMTWVRGSDPTEPRLVRYLGRRAGRQALPWITAGIIPGAERPYPTLYRPQDRPATAG